MKIRVVFGGSSLLLQPFLQHGQTVAIFGRMLASTVRRSLLHNFRLIGHY